MESNTTHPSATSGPAYSRMAKSIFFGLLAFMVVVQLFASFRGLETARNMEHAQLARELARGNGFHTQVVTPYAWRQALAHGKQSLVTQQVDSLNAPLAPLVLAPVFKILQSQWTFSPDSRIYVLDRAVAGVSILFFLGALIFVWLTVERLFDAKLAGWTIVLLVATQYLWDLALSGLALTLVFFFFAVAASIFTAALQNLAEGRTASWSHALGLGICLALMPLAHWPALWLSLGFVLAVAFLWQPHRLAVLVAVPLVLAFTAWGIRNQMVAGEILGAGKASLQSILLASDDSKMLRDFDGDIPAINVQLLVQKVTVNLLTQSNDLARLLGYCWPALLALVAFLHPFKQREASGMRWALGVIWLTVIIGLCLLGVPAAQNDSHSLHVVLIPLMAAFGLALLSVMWARVPLGQGGNWVAKHGILAGAVVVSALPMLCTLPFTVMRGIANRQAQLSHWPPYLPAQVSKLQDMSSKDEVFFSDVPWAVAWYADRTAVGIPLLQSQFKAMRDTMLANGEKPVGVLMTPYSAKVDYLSDVFVGAETEWAPQILRGILAPLGLNTLEKSDFPYREVFPLASYPLGGARNVFMMMLLGDGKRKDLFQERR